MPPPEWKHPYFCETCPKLGFRTRKKRIPDAVRVSAAASTVNWSLYGVPEQIENNDTGRDARDFALGIAKFPPASLPELARLEDEASQLVAIMVASKKTARGSGL